MERDIIGELNAYYNSLENKYQMQKQQKKDVLRTNSRIS